MGSPCGACAAYLRALFLCFSPCLVACSLTFSEEPAVPLLGDAISPELFPKLNARPASDMQVVSGVDGTPWAMIIEDPPESGGQVADPNIQHAHLVKLDGSGAEETFDTAYYITGTRNIFLFDREPSMDAPNRLRLYQPGNGGQVNELLL